MKPTMILRTHRSSWGLHHLIYLLLLAWAAVHAGGCASTTPSAPEGTDAFEVRNIAVWDGEWKDPQVQAFHFHPVGGYYGAVRCIRQSPVNPNDLLIAGDFGIFSNSTDDQPVQSLVLLSLRGGFRPLQQEGRDQSNADFYTAEFTNLNLPYYYAGGMMNLPYPGNDTVAGAGRFDDSERYWSQFNPEFPIAGNVYAITRQGDNLFIGGDFASPGTMENSGAMLRYDLINQQLTSMETGFSAPPTGTTVYAIEEDGDGVIVGGSFYQIGGVIANNIARWNGNSWETIGEGIPGTVRDIVRHNGTLYIAGMFYPSGYNGYGICARLNGSTWELVGPVYSHGMDYGNVGYALASFKGRLYLGGHFQKLGERTVNNIAVLSESGNTWEPLAGGGVQSRSPELSEEQGVKTFCVVSDRLYVGGTFDQVRVQ